MTPQQSLPAKHVSKRTVLVIASILTVFTLSLGTVAAYHASGGGQAAKTAAQPSLPQRVTLLVGDKKVIMTPTELGWKDGAASQVTLTKKLQTIANDTHQVPTDAKILQENGAYKISPSVAGQKVDVQKAVKMVRAGLFAGKSSITLPIVTVPPTVVEASLQPQLQQLKAQQAAKAAAAHMAKSATATSCASNLSGRKLILVNLSQQHLWACDGANIAYDTAITSGAYLAGTGTPTGTWRIYSKSANINLTGPGYSHPVNYWVAFYSDYGFHDSSWQTFPYGSPEYASGGSHGCVHVPSAGMTWLYSWAPVGTTVTING